MRLGQALPLALSCIAEADRVLYLVSDAVMEASVLRLNERSENLATLYAEGKPREQTYAEIVDRIEALLDEGLNVCFAVYGHPGIAADSTHAAVRRAREKGHIAEMIPGISTLDCLCADLGIDPVAQSCQLAEATEFLLYDRHPDTSAGLVLFQAGVTGDLSHAVKSNKSGFLALVEHLAVHYPADHEVTIYEAASWPLSEARVARLPLSALGGVDVSPSATLYIPALSERTLDVQFAR
ncbi:MAG: hypothetical protein JO359_00985, partial [Candidatus Eremiobacteraeota bacterium]|nr:hypothetical protein [Candidatus Eremiobacteraeota bacterium]